MVNYPNITILQVQQILVYRIFYIMDQYLKYEQDQNQLSQYLHYFNMFLIINFLALNHDVCTSSNACDIWL